jgi:alpha-D-ribose 1-methylphosphonate 5-triphosphate diphosphatase PhnM
MDHSPGERQFVLESKYREYCMGKYTRSPSGLPVLQQVWRQAKRVF